MPLKSGHRIIPVTGNEEKKQYDDFIGNRIGTIRLQPDGWFFTSPFKEFADKIYDFKFKPSDVVIMTYPKCGTTWTQEIVWTIINNPNLDHPKAMLPVNVRCPFLEIDFLLKGFPQFAVGPGNELYDLFLKICPGRDPKDGLFIQMTEMAEDPRTIKTHLPFSLLPPRLLDTCKVIHVVRNPKDVCVSYMHHSRLMKGHDFVGSVDSFVDHFINDTLLFSPFWTMVREAWVKRHHKNLLFLYYEDMKKNPKAEIMRMQNFLGKKLTTEQIDKIVAYTSFDQMKTRDNVIGTMGNSFESEFINKEILEKDGGFFRKGVTSDFKSKLNEHQIEKIDAWTKKNTESFDGFFKYKEN